MARIRQPPVVERHAAGLPVAKLPYAGWAYELRKVNEVDAVRPPSPACVQKLAPSASRG